MATAKASRDGSRSIPKWEARLAKKLASTRPMTDRRKQSIERVEEKLEKLRVLAKARAEGKKVRRGSRQKVTKTA